MLVGLLNFYFVCVSFLAKIEPLGNYCVCFWDFFLAGSKLFGFFYKKNLSIFVIKIFIIFAGILVILKLSIKLGNTFSGFPNLKDLEACFLVWWTLFSQQWTSQKTKMVGDRIQLQPQLIPMHLPLAWTHKIWTRKFFTRKNNPKVSS